MQLRLLSRTTFSLTPLLLSLFFTACSSTDDPEPEPEAAEIATTATPLIDASEEELFLAAKKLYSAGHYLVASENFQSLKDSYPLGPYQEFAEIKLADTKFFLRDYGEAASRYEEALKSRPSSMATDYLLLQAARSNQLMNTAIGRDLAPLRKSVKQYAKLIDDFPESMYVETAKFYRNQSLARIANHEKMIADFYRGQGNDQAYQARQEEFQREWAPYFTDDEEELYKVWQAEKPTVEQELQIVSATRLPSKTKTETQRELTRKPFTKKAPVRNTSIVTDSQLSAVRIREVRCDKRNGNKVTIHFNKLPPGLEAVTGQQEFVSKGGKVQIPMASPIVDGITTDCFSDNDLTVSRAGVISLETELTVRPIDLNHPPRLVLFLTR